MVISERKDHHRHPAKYVSCALVQVTLRMIKSTYCLVDPSITYLDLE